MINSYFLILLLFIVFTNLYYNYKKHSQEYFFDDKIKREQRKKKKKKKRKLEERKLEQLNNLIKNTNNYVRDNVIFDKLSKLEASQLQEYLEFLNSQDSKYEHLTEYNSVKEKISNNQTYIQNLVSNLIGEQVDWKYS